MEQFATATVTEGLTAKRVTEGESECWNRSSGE